MRPSGDNYGVQIGGSANVQAGAIAGGPSARAEASDISFTGSSAEAIESLRVAIAALVEQLRKSPPGVEDPAGLTEIAESMDREAGKDRPNKGLIRGLLTALVAGAGGAASIANAVTAIQHAVSALL
jgi:hypothetical protein